MIQHDLLIRRSAQFGGPCRFTITRQWDERLPLAAWLMCNPSEGDEDSDDQTCRRVTHFTRGLGCGGWIGVNIWALVTPYPHRLWEMLRAGRYDSVMHADNAAAVKAAGEEAHERHGPRHHPAAALRLRSRRRARLYRPLPQALRPARKAGSIVGRPHGRNGQVLYLRGQLEAAMIALFGAEAMPTRSLDDEL
jgi:hypothetical protein